MKLKLFDKALSMGQSSSQAMSAEAMQERATWVIQRWWKQLHIKQTAKESFQYIHDIVSLEQAQTESFSQLGRCIIDRDTQIATHKLLMHLEQTKDIVLPERRTLPDMHKAERTFLSAYMIVSQSKSLFESQAEMDDLLLAQAEEMLKAFEQLCAFMSEVYLKNPTTPPSSPLATRTPSADILLSNFEEYKENMIQERMKHDHQFISEGKVYLEVFHNKQIAYYETYSAWKEKDHKKLVDHLIIAYLKFEAKRFDLLNLLDPRLLELYEGYGKQQEIIKKRIYNLLGAEGDNLLDEHLSVLHEYLEQKKWSTAPTELLMHELALDPELTIPEEVFVVTPQNDIDEAIEALNQNPPNLVLILNVVEEIRNKLASFTPNNHRLVAQLEEEFSRANIQLQVQEDVQEGLYKVIRSLIEKIKSLESRAHIEDTELFLVQINERLRRHEDQSIILKDSLDLIYDKLSQINYEIADFHFKNNREIIPGTIVEFEQKQFQERLSDQQFNLSLVLNWINKLVNTPKEHRLNSSILCSKYIGSYVAPALLIGVLQQPERSVLTSIPETFYLDRVRLEHWHAHYQIILYTLTALGYMENFCKKYNLNLGANELLEEKSRLIDLLALGLISTPKEKAEDLVVAVNRLLVKQRKQLSTGDEQLLSRVIENTPVEIIKLMNRSLGDQLSCYLFKGHLPDSVGSVIKRYGLLEELKQLGQMMLPVLRLHTKVHSAFYQKQVNQSLWSPLFRILKENQLPSPLRSLMVRENESLAKAQERKSKILKLLKLEEESVKPRQARTHKFLKSLELEEVSINKIQDRIPKLHVLLDLLEQKEELVKQIHYRMHKFAYALTGLALIKQTVTCADMWNINQTIKHATLKDLAYSFGLMDMVKNPAVSKENMSIKLMELAKHVTAQQEIDFDEGEEQKLENMFQLARNGGSLGYVAFIDELMTSSRKALFKEGESSINSNSLIAEFQEEVKQINEQLKLMVEQVKGAHLIEDVDPVAQTIPHLRAGGSEVVGLGM